MHRATRTICFSRVGGVLLAILLSSASAHAAPSNDAFADALVAPGPWGRARGSNELATVEPGEPGHAGEGGGRSIWWIWSPAESGLATIHTFGSAFDTLLGVYRGDSVTSLVEVAASDDANDVAFHSLVTFAATAGIDYRIAVDGFEGTQGDVALAWHLDTTGTAAPPNDLFSARQSIVGDTGLAVTSSRNAGLEVGEPAHAADEGGKSVWWRLTPAAGGTATLFTEGSGFDTILAVYTGGTLAALTPVASDDNSGGDLSSWVRFPVVAGEEYQIAVDGHAAASGPVFLNWSVSVTCPDPRLPVQPSPADGTADVDLAPTLFWEDAMPVGGGAQAPGPAGPGGDVIYDIHFGRCGDVELAGTTEEAVWSPGQLESGVTYCWQVVTRDRCGSTAGPVWTFTTTPPAGISFIRGDAAEDGALNITDAIGVLNFLFLGEGALSCPVTADVDDSGFVNITDPVALLNFLFLSGLPPAPPSGACGPDPTLDSLTCEQYSFCE
jgi:hypothetical protein